MPTLQVRSIPLFLVYLVLLMHTYFLDLVSPRPAPRPPATGPFHRPAAAGSTSARGPPSAGAAGAPASLLTATTGAARYLWQLCADRSLAPHCLLLHVHVRRCPLFLACCSFPARLLGCALKAVPRRQCGSGSRARP